ncbi:MAG: ChaN family lipoprotein [Synechococcaceae cyanobacterium]|nr:ChaN family lipoprotein [Synechococcaceae cyanobacterium]
MAPPPRLHRSRSLLASLPPLLSLLICLPPAPSQASPAATLPAADAPSCQAAASLVERQVSQLSAAAAGLSVLLLGEVHTSAADHGWQLAVLQSLHRRRPHLSLGLEMVPAARQNTLDRFSSGSLDEAGFLREVGWEQVWGHDPDLYLPLLRWARQQRLPLLALNVEPSVVRRVRQQGLAAVPPAEREGVGPPAPVGASYRQRLQDAWQAHRPVGAAPAPADRDDLERFIDGQRLRDRAMAERLAQAHRRQPERLLVALIGRGHLEGGDGVPRQLQDLGIRQVQSALRPPSPAGCAAAPAGIRLGAYLESDAGGVWVRRIAPGSAAAAAGLRPGDRILELNGRAVERAGQVIRSVRLLPEGTPLRLTIERQGRRLQLELALPPVSSPRQAARDNGPGHPPRLSPRA